MGRPLHRWLTRGAPHAFPTLRASLASLLGDAYEVQLHPRAADALVVLAQLQPALAVIDLHLEYPRAGLDVVRAVRANAATGA